MPILNRAPFPITRLRRLRSHGFLRELVQENQLVITDLIYPIFITDMDSANQS